MMNYYITITLPIITFVIQGISHGWRSKVAYDNTLTKRQQVLYGKAWHFMDTLYTGLLVVTVYIMAVEYKDILWTLIMLAVSRFCVFSISYNISRGHSIFYVGNTGTWDSIYQKYKIWKIFPSTMLVLIKIFGLLLYYIL